MKQIYNSLQLGKLLFEYKPKKEEHHEIHLGSGECSMCECKSYEKESLLKCKCGHRKFDHYAR